MQVLLYSIKLLTSVFVQQTHIYKKQILLVLSCHQAKYVLLVLLARTEVLLACKVNAKDVKARVLFTTTIQTHSAVYVI